MSFKNSQDFLKDSEKEFLWALAVNKKEEALRSFKEISEYENIINYTINNRIEHHLYKFLRNYGLLKVIEKKHIHTIRNSIEINAKKSMITYHKGLKILNEFTKNKINYVSLKGFSYLKYSNTFNRPVRDIDVLINLDDIERAVDISIENGFRFRNHKKFSKDMILENTDIYDLPDLVDENNVCLEIHYKILRDSKCLSCNLSKSLFEDVQNFSIHGSNVKTSSLKSTISHLIYHASKKGNFDNGLGSIFDLRFLSEFLSKKDIKQIKSISDECGFRHESESFLEIIQEKNINFSHGNAYLLRELIFSPNINTKIQEFFLKKSLLQKLKNIFILIFASEDKMKREFQSNTKPILSNYLERWARQFKQFKSYIYLLVFKRKIFKKRGELIKNFYKEH
tara:strand:+ start:10885 stop:12072 length:1188 start_codon:yes stop_codon:yes gene_type:complete